jgi:ATP/maltotriose-dependent transcriptional regulator MalT
LDADVDGRTSGVADAATATITTAPVANRPMNALTNKTRLTPTAEVTLGRHTEGRMHLDDETQLDALLERAEQLATLHHELARVSATGEGRLVLIGGEAGIGKTTLVRAFCSEIEGTRVLSGACDALNTPRPLGPLIDIAEQTGGELAELVERCAGVSDLLAALGAELRRRSPTVVVLEDLHWSDEATLDVVRLLGRRVQTLPVLLIATYRDDELDRAHPMRRALGEIPRDNVARISPPPLSLSAVMGLAQAHQIDAAALHRRTAGNPFYVTEALCAEDDGLPESVRDAVLARASRLERGPRDLLDAVAVARPQAELWLLEALAGDDIHHLESCLASGMLRSRGNSVAFRHEIARLAIEEATPPDRAVALHRRAWQTLAARPGHDQFARVAHHAEAAGDAEAVLRYAPMAAERAAALGAHCQSASQYERALRFARDLEARERAELLSLHSFECYLTDDPAKAMASRRAALALYVELGDRLREGESRRWLSRMAWFSGDNDTAYEESCRAVELLETLRPGPELAMAYSTMAQLGMLAGDIDATRAWGTRATDLATRLGEQETLIHTLNNVGTAELDRGLREGVEKLERSLALALDAGLDEHVVRAHTNLGVTGIYTHDYALAERHIASGIAYCLERDLDAWLVYMIACRSWLERDRGAWEAAAESAASVIAWPGAGAPARIVALMVLGSLRARRGEPNVWEALDEAAELARATGELQRLGPVAAARAEARWLTGEAELVRAESEQALELATRYESPWWTGQLHVWRRRAGLDEPIPWELVAEPYRLELTDAFDASCAAWSRLGCPYEAAMAYVRGHDEAALRTSLEELRRLGAKTSAAHFTRALRELGARDLRQGPRASTRENAAGLTARELEVLTLVGDGLRNGDIAARLVVSRKTVDHHVSAILRKLDASTRTEAVAEASRLGVLARR